MTHQPIWLEKIERTQNGTFSHKEFEGKKLRSMKLSDYAWDKLEALGEENQCSRTEIIEHFTRSGSSEQEIVLKAIEKFIATKQSDWGNNPSQKGEFNPNSRTWDVFNQFKKFVGGVK
jgi:hypothetical protein